ncbi:MAG: aminotransferase class III-fold pyridoxal phosphate-dependent enzyme, partial [Chloroflexi bacterium]|nr:aminotransferase class III-fold pyridoxal phosphate-dependent enzyme [Chloroflexota bacterium]
DEILSGFRTGVSGAQGYFGVTPDLSTVGKALGGGVPLSAFGGRADLMSVLSPTGPAIHTGTYNAHLIPVRAGIAFLDVISGPDFYPEVLRLSNILQGSRCTLAWSRMCRSLGIAMQPLTIAFSTELGRRKW